MIARSACLVLSIGIVIACGGSDDRGLFAKNNGGSGGGYSGTAGAADGGAPNGGSSGDGGSTTGGSAGATTGGATGTGGALGGAGGASGGTGGSTGGAGGNTGGTSGSGGTVAKSTIVCGDGTCDIPGSFCCQTFDFATYDWKGACAPNGTGCQGGTITCDGPEDCNSFDDCCGTISVYAGQEYYSSFKCVQKGSCDYETNHRVICGTDPTSCPGGTSCVPSSLLPGYSACAP